MKTFINPRRVTVEGGGGEGWWQLIVAVVLIVVAAGPAAVVAHTMARVLSWVLWFGAALTFSAACGLFARWFGQREQRRELERLRAAEPQRIRWRQS